MLWLFKNIKYFCLIVNKLNITCSKYPIFDNLGGKLYIVEEEILERGL